MMNEPSLGLAPVLVNKVFNVAGKIIQQVLLFY